MKKINLLKTLLLAAGIGALVITAMSSCRAGYGCRGNQSWGKMVSRINRP